MSASLGARSSAWRLVEDMAPLHATDRYPAVLDRASWHYGVVSRRELGDLGVPPGTIASWLVNGRLQRLHMGVFAVGHTALRPEGRWRSALLTCGPWAALSHQTGMVALGHWVPEHDRLHLTTPRAGRSRDGLRVHRSPLVPADVTVRHASGSPGGNERSSISPISCPGTTWPPSPTACGTSPCRS